MFSLEALVLILSSENLPPLCAGSDIQRHEQHNHLRGNAALLFPLSLTLASMHESNQELEDFADLD